ncbi:synaptotagmin-like protein 2 [Corapipo altera]|uniref:synaptotagmin-like protein 2 n=1 Tax=Corapipo altera TaxID=415028 RepID=UPI000FD6650C|nr:synaptotagmin-like protein 2 [Corapipo altera]XP_027501252.1 synaptotagmin-like protein 2 [Corapipo altera]XP_027501253.1 synaptotagmin-like protein 2 [Corapipo altera]
MLDLSFLTEEEYEKLMKVLQRDAELKKKDGDRIRRIQGSIKDEKKKKFVTGEWFSEVKAKRFQEDLEGPDLLRASIRRKKGKLENEANEHIEMGLESKGALSPAFPEHVAGAGVERSSTPALETAEHQILPKPKPRLPAHLSASHKRPSIHDVSSSESDTGTSPFVTATNGFHLSRKGHGVSPLPTKLSEDAVPQPSSAAGGEAVDGATGTTVGPKTPPEEASAPSKIPVKRKPSRISPRSEQFVNPVGPAENSLAKKELPASPKPLTMEGESNQAGKQGVNYTISSMSNKEEDIGLDREHFKNLKDFWEKAADSMAVGSPLTDPSGVEADGRQFKLCRSLSVQSGQGQSSEEKTGTFTKTRTPYKRTITLSSSEEEPSYVAPARKGSVSVTPRSTYAKSKGGLLARNNSLSESNGKLLMPEEEKVAQRCSKKSRLPVRAPSVKTESPTKEVSGSTLEPETPTDELIVAEERKPTERSLASRVQIMIEPVLTDGENGDEKDERPDLGTHDNMEISGELPEGKTRESSDKPTPGEPSGEREAVQGTDSAVYSEEDGDHSPAAQALARANSINLAKSMVNIYTTTETYNKPHLIPHQFLEPERVKELSRSSPVLLSETESDTASEISFQFNKHKKTPSVGSHSSDMASVSSVSGSVLSVYSGDFGSVDAQGTVEFALDYDEKNREFQVHVSQCKDLAVVDEKKGRSDPYVKTYLLPDKARMGKRKTSVKKRTVNPIYNEVLRYKIEKMVLLIQKLNLSVWHNDPLGRNSFLGEIEIDLASWDWSNRKLNWYPLKPRSLSAVNGVDHRGVMSLSIKYVPPGSLGPKNPPSGEVHIWVKDVKDLLQLRPSGVDSFVKCYVLPDTSKKSYQKTRVIKRDTNPVFNHTIVYDGFHTEDLKDACVELTVWDHEKLTNHFLGGIRLGLGTGLSYGISVDWMDSTQEEVAFWQEMMLAANEWIEGLLPLRSLAGRKKLK